MPSLVDIAPAVEQLTLRGVEIEVHGVGIDAIARVLAGSEGLRALLTEGSAVDAITLLQKAPEAVHALMAAAVIGPDDDPIRALHRQTLEAEAAARLPFGDQVTLAESIMRLSFPGGILPFVDKLTGMLGSGPGPAPAGAGNGRAPDTSSPPAPTN
jgi:hypothetical protein